MDALKKCVEEEFSKKPKLIPLNLMALEAGAKAAKRV
jgi:2-oxoglutarate ferredoxin oxidoreductase subunit gamma